MSVRRLAVSALLALAFMLPSPADAWCGTPRAEPTCPEFKKTPVPKPTSAPAPKATLPSPAPPQAGPPPTPNPVFAGLVEAAWAGRAPRATPTPQATVTPAPTHTPTPSARNDSVQGPWR